MHGVLWLLLLLLLLLPARLQCTRCDTAVVGAPAPRALHLATVALSCCIKCHTTTTMGATAAAWMARSPRPRCTAACERTLLPLRIHNMLSRTALAGRAHVQRGAAFALLQL